MQFDAFSPFGLWDFSSEPSPAEGIYDALCAAYRGMFDLTPGTYAEARVYAMAMAMAEARCSIRAALSEASPSTALDKIPTLERDYLVTPPADATITQRRAKLVALDLLMRGAREEAITTDLQALLGSSFIKLRATQPSEVKTFPTAPNAVGTIPKDDAPLVFCQLLDSVKSVGVSVTVPILVVSEIAPQRQQLLTVEPEVNVVAERITVDAVQLAIPGSGLTQSTLTATFAKAHSAGAWIVNQAPLWFSTQRILQVFVTTAAGRDPDTRRKIHEVMARHSRMVSRWEIIESADRAHSGPFVVGVSRVGSTALGSAAFTF